MCLFIYILLKGKMSFFQIDFKEIRKSPDGKQLGMWLRIQKLSAAPPAVGALLLEECWARTASAGNCLIGSASEAFLSSLLPLSKQRTRTCPVSGAVCARHEHWRQHRPRLQELAMEWGKPVWKQQMDPICCSTAIKSEPRTPHRVGWGGERLHASDA